MNDANQDDDDGDNQQNMNKSAHRVRSDHPEKPKNKKYDANCPKHDVFLSSVDGPPGRRTQGRGGAGTITKLPPRPG